MVRRRSEIGWTEPAVLILSSLAGGSKHGYAIIKDVEQQCAIVLGPGTLYAALSRLVDAGLVEALPGEDRRRPYRITDEGAAVLQERLTAMQRLARVGLRRLGRAST